MSDIQTLQEVLRGGRQCDEDGTEIIMSREACCVAADTIDSLQARVAELEMRSTDDAKAMLRLIATINYITGIAERGESRKMLLDELPEKFVLDYVKKLESKVAEQDKLLALALEALKDAVKRNRTGWYQDAAITAIEHQGEKG